MTPNTKNNKIKLIAKKSIDASNIISRKLETKYKCIGKITSFITNKKS